ncbi:MAG: NUDIX hydrolase [Bacteroidales bacterium]|jgi:8-oxo-dGTP diphosphatase|nr:NUDIX hydrolase [Bacteroidales bacterium]
MSYTYEYPRPMVTVDALVFAGNPSDKHVLLICRGNEPFKGMWALPGGFVEMDETLDNAVARELSEETGLSLGGFKQLYTFGNPGRDPRGRNITVVFQLTISEIIPVTGGDDADDAKWYSVHELPELAFDHEKVIKMGLKQL